MIPTSYKHLVVLSPFPLPEHPAAMLVKPVSSNFNWRSLAERQRPEALCCSWGTGPEAGHDVGGIHIFSPHSCLSAQHQRLLLLSTLENYVMLQTFSFWRVNNSSNILHLNFLLPCIIKFLHFLWQSFISLSVFPTNHSLLFFMQRIYINLI